MKEQILVVEDEQAIAAFVQTSLERGGKVFGREMLLERVWGYDYAGESRTVDVHIQRLRTKIESDPAQPCYLLTVYGIGYKFASGEDL